MLVQSFVINFDDFFKLREIDLEKVSKINLALFKNSVTQVI